MGGVNGVGLGAMGVGAIFMYGGLTGKSPLAALQAIVKGESPAKVLQSSPLTIQTTAITSTPTGPGSKASGSFTGGQDSTPGGGSGNARVIAARLATHIRSRNAIAGILGNIEIESGFDPTRPNPAEGAIGLCQWELGRRTNLQRFATSRGTTETDLTTQIDFIWHELTGGEAAALLPLLGATSPEAAAAVFDSMYERSAGTARGARESAARKWYNTLYGSK